MKKPAILFWYYKTPEVCAERLHLLRRLNPGLPIYGLYGGNIDEYPRYEAALRNCLDDNWGFPGSGDVEWKWRHGDLMISDWHRKRGKHLSWDTLVMMQWDMVALAPIRGIFAELGEDEIFLPGLRPMEDLEPDWWWVRPQTAPGDEYMHFKNMMETSHGFTGPYQACQFVTAVFQRAFMDAYSEISNPELGFLEYKLPAYASLFGFSLARLPCLDVTWPGEPSRNDHLTLTAAKREIQVMDIIAEYLRPGGARLFHPVSGHFPPGRAGMVKLIARELPGLLMGHLKKRLHARQSLHR